MSEGLSVAVVIPTLRRPADLRRCLAGVVAQTRPPQRVIVVVSAGDPPSATVAGEFADRLPLETVTVTAPGQVAALNAGVWASAEDVVAITDDDAVPRPRWLERIGRTFASDPRIGAVGGRDWLWHDGEPVLGAEPVVGRVLWYGRFVGFHHLGMGPARDVEFLKGVNMAYRRTALAGFDQELRGRGVEHFNDWAASLRVRREGWRIVYDPAIAVDHYEGDRGDLDPRARTDPRVTVDHVHNQTYAALRYLPPRRAVVHLLFGLLVGTTAGPGLALTLRNVLAGADAATAWRQLRSALRARSAGVRSALRAA